MILIRHEACGLDLTADPGLTDEGNARARAQWLAGHMPQVILHSPRRRARETAEAFAAILRPAAVCCVEVLREIHPAIIATVPPSEHPDLERAQRLLREVIRPSLDNSSI